MDPEEEFPLEFENILVVDYDHDLDNPEVVQALWLNTDDPEELE